MPAIVEIPKIVEDALDQFADLFANAPQRCHFAEYLTGLIVSSNKTVSGIQAEFAKTTDQSCLNRFLTSVNWDVEALNERRLEWMQTDRSTRYHKQGVIALDDVLIDHDGKLIKDVGWFWDHAEQRHKIAHDDLFANYVCPNGKHYPLEFRRFKKREQCEATGEKFQDHGVLFRQLIDWVCEREIPGAFTFDSYFSSSASLNHIHEQKNPQSESRAYVGDLKTNRKLEVRGKSIRADEFAATIARESRKELRRGDDRQWYFTSTVRLPQVKHLVRIVLIWKNRRDKKVAKVLVTNRTHWEIHRILKTYRYRWTGTETFHRDGKQELGMGDCQLRSGQGQTRHMYLVMLAYSLLMKQLKQPAAKAWALKWLTTIGQAGRAVANETLRTTLEWAMKQSSGNFRQNQHVLAQLGLISRFAKVQLLTENLSLCWIHAGRHYEKLSPVVTRHAEALEGFLDRYWDYYASLQDYCAGPRKKLAKKLRLEFDELFSTQTMYAALDDRIAKTAAKKDELLTVLLVPEVPLHNNASELGARVSARRRDVSLHSRSERGVRAMDIFTTLVQTSKKLGISAFAYIRDRLSGALEMPSLAQTILQTANTGTASL